MSFGLEKEIEQLSVESSGLDKAQDLKIKKASSRLKNEIKQLRVESSGLDKAHGLKRKKKASSSKKK